jgi:hypothetical protein
MMRSCSIMEEIVVQVFYGGPNGAALEIGMRVALITLKRRPDQLPSTTTSLPPDLDFICYSIRVFQKQIKFYLIFINFILQSQTIYLAKHIFELYLPQNSHTIL